MEFIQVENLTKTYYLGEIDVPVLKGVSLTIKRGEMVALIGASGSGKTTLMNILGCLDRPTSGKYWLDGEEMSQLTPDERAVERTSKIGFVFQNFNLLPRTPALNNVLMPLDYSVRAPSLHEAKLRAIELLERVGLGDRLDHQPSQMSGGQQQRVAIARSLVNQPALVLADEPTGNLDSKTSVEILAMFRELNKVGITVILVTHDPKVAAAADRRIRVVDGLIESDESSAVSASVPIVPPPNETAVNGVNGHSSNGWSTNGDHGGSGSSDQGASSVAVAAPPTRTQMAAQPEPEVSPAMNFAAGGPASLHARHTSPSLAQSLALLIPATLRTAFSDLRRNKMRSGLTTLGIIIGVGAVIAMMEIGQGSKSAIEQSIASMGANNLMIMSGAASSGGVSFGGGSAPTLTPQDGEEIAKRAQGVQAVAPVVRVRAQVVYGNKNWVPMNIYGTTPSFVEVRDWSDLDEGNMFTERDVLTGNKVCLIGQTIARELFQGTDPIGQEIRIRNVSLKVIGILSRKGANMMGMDQDDTVIAPWTTIKYRISGNNAGNVNQSDGAAGGASGTVNTISDLYPGAAPLYLAPTAQEQADTPQIVRFTNVDQLLVKAASADVVPVAIDQINTILRERHRVKQSPSGDYADDFNIRDMTELTKTLTAQSDTMRGLLLGVALISLVVGGVGIMNIMLVSVTERTREIGLRMAVGAQSHHILKQFLTEAIVLCLLGGIVGILTGRGVTWLVRVFMHWRTEASLPAIIIAFAVSVFVGIVFGFYPAWKASRLDPIEALRYE